MLEDFIEVNNLSAKISETIRSFNLIKCRVFFSGEETILAISLFHGKLDFSAIKKLLNSTELLKVDGKKAIEITGYEEQFMPPITIYGVNVLIDEKVMNLDEANVLIGEEKTLTISPKEILEANEEAIVAKITE